MPKWRTVRSVIHLRLIMQYIFRSDLQWGKGYGPSVIPERPGSQNKVLNEANILHDAGERRT